MKLAFLTFVASKNPPNMHIRNKIKDIENGRHSLHMCVIYNTKKVGNATFLTIES